MRVGKTAPFIAGMIIGLMGLALLASGAVLGVIHATQRDSDGYYMSPTGTYSTDARAIASGAITLVEDIEGVGWVPDDLFGEIRVDVNSTEPIFVGIGTENDVRAYLRDVSVAEVGTVKFAPFEVRYQRSPGDREPTAPTGQDFWLAELDGSGHRSLTWDVTEGSYVVVMMNNDTTAGVSADVGVGVRTTVLLSVSAALLVIGIVLGTGGAAMMVAAFAGRGPLDGAPTTGTVTPPSQSAGSEVDQRAGAYPVRMSAQAVGIHAGHYR